MFNIGDLVQINETYGLDTSHPTDLAFIGQRGRVTSLPSSDSCFIEVDLVSGKHFYAIETELSLVDEYEQARQRTIPRTPRYES
jgi:hypothetical protein